MSDIKRKKGESFEAFIRRVKRRWKQSGVILQARKVKFHRTKLSKNVQRTQTVRKNRIVSKTNYLRKIGKMPPEEDSFRRRR